MSRTRAWQDADDLDIAYGPVEWDDAAILAYEQFLATLAPSERADALAGEYTLSDHGEYLAAVAERAAMIEAADSRAAERVAAGVVVAGVYDGDLPF